MDLETTWTPTAESSSEERARIEFQFGTARHELDVVDVADLAFEDGSPVRIFPAWPGKRNYDGSFWMSRTARSVPFELLEERAFLIELDRCPDVVGVSSQPMWIRWSSGVAASHAPDYFVRLSDGRSVLVDVRPTKRIDERAKEQFNRTSWLCARLGWRYVVWGGASPIREANLRFLMRFRDPRWDRVRVPELSGGPGLGEVAAALGGGDEGLARAYGLLWHGELVTDLERPLSMRSRIESGERR